MYKYELLNNHYIVHIDGKKYLIDTGSYSFWITTPMSHIVIDDKAYRLDPNPLSATAMRKTFDLVGTEIDGFIGLDIIVRTSLTIYKDGNIDFKANELPNGKRVPLVGDGLLQVKASSGCISGLMIIDTGAMYGYGIKEIFDNETPYALGVHDFNPNPKIWDIYTDMYHQEVFVNGKLVTLNMGYNQKVYGFPLNEKVIMVGNVTTLFDEVCVIDIPNRQLILK